MMIANEIASTRGFISDQRKAEVNQMLSSIVIRELLKPEYLELERYLGVLKKDKKYTGGKHNCILWNEQGVNKYNDVTDEEIANACRKVLEYNG